MDGCGHGFATGIGEAKGWLKDAVAFWEQQRNRRWFSAERVNDHIIRIAGAADELMYLVEGSERAALLDTGVGMGDLRGYVEAMTEKPVTVLLTHGHIDHAMGACEFEGDIYMSPEDDALYRYHSTPEVRRQLMEGLAPDSLACLNELRPLTYAPIYHGDTWDFGGITIQAFACPGHTRGSVVFLIVEDRLLLLGDACNANTLVYDAFSTSIEEYRESLIRLQEEIVGKVELTLYSHYSFLFGPEAVPQMIELCGRVMEGKADDIPIEFLDSTQYLAKQVDEHFVPLDGTIVNLQYNKERVFREEEEEVRHV